jgi:hypothetical protein
MSLLDFRNKLCARRDQLSQLRALVDGALLCQDLLAEFDAAMAASEAELLSLAHAAAQSGYSSDHLRRLARIGAINVHRRGRRLFFRAADLPKKPNSLDRIGKQSYNPHADARRLAVRRIHGRANHGTHKAA